MTIPTLAATGAGGHRVYRWQGREFPSVTAILGGGVPKLLLPRWAAKVAAEYAIAHLDHLRRLPPGQAIREVKQAPFAKRDDPFAAIVHSITLLALIRSDCGILRPKILAVLPLINISNFVGCSMGKSPGFAPLNILSTYVATRK